MDQPVKVNKDMDTVLCLQRCPSYPTMQEVELLLGRKRQLLSKSRSANLIANAFSAAWSSRQPLMEEEIRRLEDLIHDLSASCGCDEGIKTRELPNLSVQDLVAAGFTKASVCERLCRHVTIAGCEECI
jgi:hypothetical protein